MTIYSYVTRLRTTYVEAVVDAPAVISAVVVQLVVVVSVAVEVVVVVLARATCFTRMSAYPRSPINQH